MSTIADEIKSILDGDEETLSHHGVKGMKWGVRRTPEQLGHVGYAKGNKGGSYTSDDVVFVSGKVKYDSPIPRQVKRELDNAIKAKSKIIIGDAPGADTRCQDYLAEKNYKNVTVYTTDETVRNNVGNWNVKKISGHGETEERKIRAQKDIAMSNEATKGIVISSDDDRPDSATSLNIQRLSNSKKPIQFYDFKKDILSDEDQIERVEHSSTTIADEIMTYYGAPKQEIDHELLHYGIKRRSGRYPYGSGEEPFQHGRDFLGRVDELKKSGFTYTDEKGKKWTGDNAIAKSMGLTSTEYRRQISWANYETRLQDVARVKSLQKDGYNNTEIGKIMGKNESSIRTLLNEQTDARMRKTMETVNFLRDQVDKKGMVDVGKDVEIELGMSRVRLDNALDYLEKAEGYHVYKGGIPQINAKGQQTNQMVLCKPEIPHKDIYQYDKVKTINEYTSHDGGDTFNTFVYPKSMDSKRLAIRYKEDGGIDKDGIIEVRRGVDDLYLGDGKQYAQVRILVDKTHFIKGMAVYGDDKDFPPGVDVMFNTNKTKDKSKMEVLKKIKPDDPDNPFGSLIKPGGQSYYIDKNGKKQLSLINKPREQGDWSDWKDALPSQFLGKQSLNMAKKQLGLAKADKLAEFDEICSLENPTIKKHLLRKFADSCDSAAVHLQAAALPGQKYHVIIPVNTLKDNEVFAPNYPNGTKLALIRYPHGGTFEIPICTVNNKNALANKLLGTKVEDAVGINARVAERLSGADFDGDTVMCIPTHDSKGKVKITSTKPLAGLEGFDPKTAYPEVPGMKVMKNKGNAMGRISNLITDMTLAGANSDELARAVRHSMVVIDAEKHHLDYKRSELDNDIAGLMKKYQPKYDLDGNKIDGKGGGASTILSRSKGEYTVDKRQGSYKINDPSKDWYDPTRPDGAKLWKTTDDLYKPVRNRDKTTGIVTIRTEDGKKITYDSKDKKAVDMYNPVKRVDEKTGEVTFTNKDGSIKYKVEKRTEPSTQMAETDDAYKLVSKSRHPMELAYADYANDMKALGNRARMELVNTGKIAYSAEAKAKYAEEVKSLNDKLNGTVVNSVKERAALRIANTELKSKVDATPDMKGDTKRKIGQQAMNRARKDVGAVARRDRNINITDKEWEAIQAGAVSETTLTKILNNTDIDKLRERAMPRSTNSLSTAQINRMKAMSASNYSLSEIAQKLGVSTSTVSNYLKGVK